MHALDRIEAGEERASIGDHRRDRRALEAEAEAEDEERVEHGDDRRDDESDVHRPPRVAEPAQDEAERHRGGDEDEARNQRPQIVLRQPQCLAVGAEQPQERFRSDGDGERDDERNRRRERRRVRREVTRRLDAAGADVSRHVHGRRDAAADRQRQVCESDGAGKADRRGDLRAPEKAEEEEIGQIDEEHRHEAERAGEGHHRHVPHGRAGEEAGLARRACRSGGRAHLNRCPEGSRPSVSTSRARGGKEM